MDDAASPTAVRALDARFDAELRVGLVGRARSDYLKTYWTRPPQRATKNAKTIGSIRASVSGELAAARGEAFLR